MPLRASLEAQLVKNPPAMQETWVGKVPWRREWQPTPVFLPGEFHGQRSLAGCSPWACKESDTTAQLTFPLPLFHMPLRLVPPPIKFPTALLLRPSGVPAVHFCLNPSQVFKSSWSQWEHRQTPAEVSGMAEGSGGWPGRLGGAGPVEQASE